MIDQGCIYLLTFPNGKYYVGQTINFDRRMKQHRYYSEHISKEKKEYFWPLYTAIRKHGWENITKEILEVVCVEDLDHLEETYQIKYNSFIKENGYNLIKGGQINRVCSEETRQKLSACMLGNKRALGNKWNVGRKATLESRTKMSNSQKCRPNTTDETKLKMSKANSIKNSKRVGCYDSNGILVATYRSATEASRLLRLCQTGISGCARGKTRSCGGFVWKYI